MSEDMNNNVQETTETTATPEKKTFGKRLDGFFVEARSERKSLQVSLLSLQCATF